MHCPPTVNVVKLEAEQEIGRSRPTLTRAAAATELAGEGKPVELVCRKRNLVPQAGRTALQGGASRDTRVGGGTLVNSPQNARVPH
jgi:hypothetical protein